MSKQILSREQALFSAGLIVGVILFALFRFTTYVEPVHYHANFAVYENGQRDTFDGPGFYESVTSCSATDAPTASHRTHMHDEINNVVHVHEDAVTWGMFFENIGYSVGERHLATNTTVFSEDDTQAVRFMLNGEEVDDIANTVIKSEDKLLVSVTSPNTDLKSEFETVDGSAGTFNSKADPASCSGDTSPFELRLKNIYESNQ